jgi:hypothetical protein
MRCISQYAISKFIPVIVKLGQILGNIIYLLKKYCVQQSFIYKEDK